MRTGQRFKNSLSLRYTNRMETNLGQTLCMSLYSQHRCMTMVLLSSSVRSSFLPQRGPSRSREGEAETTQARSPGELTHTTTRGGAVSESRGSCEDMNRLKSGDEGLRRSPVEQNYSTVCYDGDGQEIHETTSESLLIYRHASISSRDGRTGRAYQSESTIDAVVQCKKKHVMP